MGFVETMKERGLLAQVTHEEELLEHLSSATRTAYMGFDPTADSLHVGSLMSAMTLRRWQKAGHRVVVLVGGGTGLVGDPTGKTDLRKMLTAEDITSNIEKFKVQLSKFLDLSSPDKGVVVNNADWLLKLEYLPFLRDIGKYFSVNRMLTAECFKQRLEKGLTFLEFNYMLLQSYDFLELYKAENVTVQLGGDDQWSNMLGGTDLVRRVTQGKAYCMTTPLLTTSEGKKMGKTEKGAVWLDAEKTTPFDFYQYWRNIDDKDVEKSFYYMTEIPVAEVKTYFEEGKNINEAKKRLAYEITQFVHSKEAADKARETALNLFSKGGQGTGNEPEHFISSDDFASGLSVLDFLTIGGIVPSKAEARRLVKQGGLSLNGEKVLDVTYLVTDKDMNGEEGCLVRKGKKHYYRLRIS